MRTASSRPRRKSHSGTAAAKGNTGTTSVRAGVRPRDPAGIILFDQLRRLVLRLRGFLGRHLSVRWKLTLWYGLMCAATLGLIGTVMLYALTRSTSLSIDTSLKSTSETMAPLLSKSTVGMSQQTDPDQLLTTYQRNLQRALDRFSVQASAPGQFEQVQILFGGQCPFLPECNPMFPASTAPYLKPGGGSRWHGILVDPRLQLNRALVRPFYATLTQNGEVYRVYFTGLTLPSVMQQEKFRAVLEVFQNEHSYIQTQHDLTVILLFGIPIGLLVALVAGWWIARAALRPIDRISKTVQTIGESQDLSRRVNSVGPPDELGRLADTFDAMMDRLEQAFEAQRRFVADASHELRTPLTVISGNAQLLRIAPEEEREVCVTSIRQEAERMTRLVADLLSLAEADQDGHRLHLESVDLGSLVEDVYSTAVSLAGTKVTVQCGTISPITVAADADRLKQLLLNLVENAIKFTPQGGTVTLALYHEPGVARISVSDTGVGIPQDEQEAIFRRFYRTERSRTTRGSGLGLSIAHLIAAAHGGRIEVESTLGVGSTFSVVLPAAGQPQRKPEPERLETPAAS